jgi:hypothetical protein
MGMLRSAAWIALAGSLLSACGGGGGGGGSPPPPAGDVTISGRITFDRIPFKATLGTGLNPGAAVESPARQVTVQAIDAASGAVLATATTDLNGDYSVTVPGNRNLFIRARAEMVKTGAAPTWNFSVRNNSNSDALYALDGNAASSGTANTTRNLRAPTGFGATDYVSERAAAPFAILDSVFRAKELVLGAAANTEFPQLNLFWSVENRPTVLPNGPEFCPDDGDIGTSSYVVFLAGDLDTCNQPGVTGIYILGDFTAGDTDEFDQSVITHEFGHFVEDRFSRSDSIGGGHAGSADLLDLRVAFGEGWGNAFSGMALGSPLYRDSFDGMDQDLNIDLEFDDPDNEGWFSEASVGEILWDVFDSTNEAGDAVALGFTPIFAVMTGPQVTTAALTSIYPFATGLLAANGGLAAQISDLLDGEDIAGTGDFGVGEINDAGDFPILPVYKPIDRIAPVTVCSRSPAGDADTNKVGNRVFLQFVNDATRTVTIQATGAVSGGGTVAATDPDIFVLQRGNLAAFGAAVGPTETISQVTLPAATYVIEVYDFDMDEVANTSPRCMTVSITG